MYSTCMCTQSEIRGPRVFVLSLLIILVFLYLTASRSPPGQKLANLWGKPNENYDQNSGSGLFLDKGLSENGHILPLRENSRQDNTGNSSKFIFVNSYMRSGSSFLGRVLGFRSDVFYFYEPLRKLWTWRYTKGSKLCDLKKPSCDYSYDAQGKTLKFLSDIFNCRFQNHSEKINTPLKKMLSGTKWNSFNKCVAQHKQDKVCLGKVEDQCLLAKYRAVKVLRMSLADVALLLPKHPNLVIVHLFRDPRGTFNSHITTGWFPVKMGNIEAFVNDTKSNCERIREDLITGKMLKTKFPDRVNLVQYEDIYGNVEKIKSLYRRLGMDMLQESDEFLRTQVHRKDEKTKQSSYLSGPFNYRKSLSFKYLQIIENECKEAIRLLGLKLYTTEFNLHDNEFNPIDGKLPFEL